VHVIFHTLHRLLKCRGMRKRPSKQEKHQTHSKVIEETRRTQR
jgi:hypothetical protein